MQVIIPTIALPFHSTELHCTEPDTFIASNESTECIFPQNQISLEMVPVVDSVFMS